MPTDEERPSRFPRAAEPAYEPEPARTEARPDREPRRTPPPRGEEPPAEGSSERRRRLEGLLGEAFRRAVERGVEAGVGTLKMADKLRDAVDDVPVPKEIAGYVFAQVDETKNALVRVVAREVREFLDATDVATELQRALTSLSFEIKTEVRFIPNDAGGIRPSVKAKAAPKVKRRSETPPAPPDETEED